MIVIPVERDLSELFIDLIYIDPTLNSKSDYNVLSENINVKDATAQNKLSQTIGVM